MHDAMLSLVAWLRGKFFRREHGDIPGVAKVCLVPREYYIGAAIYRGAKLQRILEIIQPEFDSAKRVNMADGSNRGDAKQVTNELDCLFSAAITAQDVEEVGEGMP